LFLNFSKKASWSPSSICPLPICNGQWSLVGCPLLIRVAMWILGFIWIKESIEIWWDIGIWILYIFW
jgi:hypothetical protein